MSTFTIILISVIIVVTTILFLVSYVKAPPSTAFIISGLSKEPRVLIGKGGIKIPFFERLDKVFLGQTTVDIKTSRPVPTNDFINVNIDAVAKVRVMPTPEGIRLAAKNFLNMTSTQISEQITDSLEGNMRETAGSLSLKEINIDRDAFSDKISAKAGPDMQKLGLEIISCNIQNITDDIGLIKDLGADNTYKIKKDAAITKANAERDISKAQSQAAREANDIRVQSETAIAEKNNELKIKQAELQKQSDAKKAEADAAYQIQQQEQQKTINIKTVEADIEKTKKEQILTEEKIKIERNYLQANINAKADADKYKTEIEAQADLEQKKRDAEAKAYMAKQEAEAIRVKAEAEKYAKLQEAEGIKAVGEAEASAALAKYQAEAEGMERKAEAFKQYGNAAITDMIVKILPDIAKNVAEPMKSIDNVNIYGSSADGITTVSGNVPTVIKQVFDTVSSATGVDMQDIMKSHTIDAQVNKNITGELGLDIKNKSQLLHD